MLTEKEAWEYIANQFELPVEERTLDGTQFGICICICRAFGAAIIDKQLKDNMEDKMWPTAKLMLQRTCKRYWWQVRSYSRFWTPHHDAMRAKYCRWQARRCV